MTDQELQAIRERAKKATAGPWRYAGSAVVIVAPDTKRFRHIGSQFRHHEDASFCAHARQDIPALLAEVKRLRKALNEIAAWGEGPVVTGSFDCPPHAEMARQVLAEVNRSKVTPAPR